MLIRYASDLHLEFVLRQQARALDLHEYDDAVMAYAFTQAVPEIPSDRETVMVLAGDILAAPAFVVTRLLKMLQNRFAQIIYIPGNHEYYGRNYAEWNTEFTSLIAEDGFERVHASASATEVGVWSIDGIQFVYGTLWGHGGNSLQERALVGAALNDFRVITAFGHNRFTVPFMVEINAHHSAAIKQILQQSTAKTKIVVTHHLPTDALCHPRFGSDINGGFASREESLLNSEFAPDYWIFGHTHDTYDTTIGKTRMLCNPKGYPNEHDSGNYNSYGVKALKI